jgi:UDP:flavonoid glycosyltransferase YjiC (YdhE family)
LDEIAAGLRDSGVRYLWVARAEASLFKEGCGGMGLVVPWCDQLRVLCHPSLGGFWSHCGWGSTSEAAFSGIPLLTFPLYLDQAPNSKIIVDDWKIGWRVKSGLDVDKLIKRDEIAGLVKRFMDSESDEVKEMRRRAREISEICRRAIRKGGSSDTSIDAFIDDILQHHKN